jgi:heparosan-N-sulfate-glucuronate 5-epimerase
MPEEYKHIKLTLGDTSLDEKLGIYYIDFRDSLIHYESDFYGDKDANGIPLSGVGKDATYYPIVVAQYGLLLHAQYLKENSDSAFQKMAHCVSIICELMKLENETIVWRHNSFYDRFNLKPGWASAMAQGQCMSLLLRWHQITNDHKYLNYANQAYEFMKIPSSEGGVRAWDKEGNVWLEEYPSTDGPSCVLNGFIYALWGLYDLYRVTGNSEVKEDIDRCVITLKNCISNFDVGYWSIYDQYTFELVRYYYQKNVHVPQLCAMYDLTQEDIFLHYAEKWKKTVNWKNYFLVQIMYRVRPRFLKLKKMLS